MKKKEKKRGRMGEGRGIYTRQPASRSHDAT
jgi:hypothetical protein